MADLSDVVATLAATVTAKVYPNGTSSAPVAGDKISIMGGWPLDSDFETIIAARAAGVTHTLISIYPRPGMYRGEGRYGQIYQDQTRPPKTVTATVSGQTVTVAGTAATVHNVGVIMGVADQKRSFVYPAQPGDTAAVIASGLAALINAVTPASALGAVVTIPAAWSLIARVGVIGTATRELRRQTERFDVNIWSSDPAVRDQSGAPLRVVFASIDFLTLPDNYAARIIVTEDGWIDEPEKIGLWRRLISFDIEYPTTETADFAEIIIFEEDLTGGQIPDAAPVITTLY